MILTKGLYVICHQAHLTKGRMSQFNNSVLRTCHSRSNSSLCPVKRPNYCKEPVGTVFMSDTERSDRVTVSQKSNQTSFKNKKQYHQHLSGNFQLSIVKQDVNHYHVRRSDSTHHVDSIVDCEQATEHNKPEQLPELQKCDFRNEYCESDKCSDVKLIKPLDNDLHSELFKHDSEPDRCTRTEAPKSLQRQDSVQLNTTRVALNNQDDFEHHPSSSNAFKSKHKAGTVTETSTAMKTPQYQDHNWTRDNAVVVDVPHKHDNTREKHDAAFAAPSKPQYYNKTTYIVLVRDSVKVVNTKLYASLPVRNKYMVKERIPGTNKVKLVLKSSDENERFVKVL